MRVVATAGHVDHGKSTLVWALTGVDPDRWAIEKQRGMTIDLGFAATTLPSGAEIGFVDVPGHGRFVKNMLAGVGSADACLFVVAANEGWKAQSEEHLRILDLLGVGHGVIALTKAELAGTELTELAAAEVEERVAGTFLRGAPIIPVDVVASQGLDGLRAALEQLVARVPQAADRGRPRVWIDRAFAIRGSGTVVTGTLTGGSIGSGDQMVVEPGGYRVRLRTLESHNRTMAQAGPGRRVAANLVGVHHHQVGRGQALVRPGQWHLTDRFDASLTVLAGLDHEVSRRGAYAVYVGSGEFPARLRVLGPRPIEPGATGYVRLWLAGPAGVPLTPGDRYVLREAGRFETVGGGEVLDVEPVLPASRAEPSRSPERVIRERGWVDAGRLFRLTGEQRPPTVGRWVVDPAALAVGRAAIAERCRGAGPEGVQLAHFSEHDRALVSSGVEGVEIRDDRAYLSRLASDRLSDHAARLLERLEAAGWSPPTFGRGDGAALRELAKAGRAVQSGDTWFAAAAVGRAVQLVAELLDEQPGGFTVADARDRLDSSRKFVLPLLAHLDAIGVTARRGDLRVAGRRLAARPAAPSVVRP